MASLEELKATRVQKLELLKKAGMDPYPAKVPRTFCLEDARKNYSEGKEVSLAGRVMAIRGQGAILFVVLKDGKEDGRAHFQAVFKKDVLNEKLFKLFTDAIDIGDFISVTGTYFKTQKGEESLLVTDWVIATKTLLPLPEKWHGIQDTDERYRKRYLDLLMNQEMHEIFIKKAKFWDVTRKFLKDNGFLEVETPTLELTTGGAEATPFKTHHNDYDLDVYMRISIGELWQKRLMAAGYPKTFEIGRAYRNEGTSPDHAQEFTNMEFYWSFADYNDGMDLVKDMYRTIAKEVFGTTKFTTRGHTFDLADEWVKIDYAEEIKKQTGVDVNAASEKDIIAKLQELNVKYEGTNRERLTDTLWKYCRKNISGPSFLVGHPLIVSPLAKPVKGTSKTQQFQPLLAGSELGKGYSELNDPIDQLERFHVQKKLLEGGDTEAMMADEEFVEMLEHGMPPTCGFGFGERLFAFFVDKPLREVQTFPLMRPKDSVSPISKKKENKVAIALINSSAITEDWQKLNTAAHLAASLAARSGTSLLHTDKAVTKDNKKINLNIQHAIMMKEAKTNKDLLKVIEAAHKLKLEVHEFTREMISTTSDKKVLAMTAEKNFDDIERLGILVFGPKSLVEEITKDFPLLK
jgi:lysyl-tRNA synthetase class 2